MGCAVSERPLDVVPKTGLVHFGLHQKQQIHEVLHARVVSIDPGTRVRVELFGDVRLDRIQPQHRRRDAGAGEDTLGNYDFGFAEDRVTECVHAEGL